MSYDRFKLDTPDYLEDTEDEEFYDDEEDTDLSEFDEPTDPWDDIMEGEPKFYSANDKNGWKKAGLLSFEQFASEIKFFNRRQIDDIHEEGEFYFADDKNLTIYSGEFGRHNKPGAVYCTYAEVFPDSESYNDSLEMYEQFDDYDNEDDEEEDFD